MADINKARKAALEALQKLVPDVAAQKALRETNPEKYAEYLKTLDSAYGPRDARAAEMGLNKFKFKNDDGVLDLKGDKFDASGEFVGPDTLDMLLDLPYEEHNLPYDNAMYLRSLRVRPEEQGRGLGSKALKLMEQKAKQSGADGVVLNASPLGSDWSLRDETRLNDLVNFYKNNGYIPIKDEGTNVLMHKPSADITDESIIRRQKDAALDPRFKDSSDILALAPKKGMEGVRPQDYFNKGMDVLDKQVVNRSRAALMAALSGQNPIDAAMQNKYVDEAEIGRKILDKTDPNSYVHNANIPKNDDQWKDYLETPVGLAVSAPFDPTNLVPAGGANKVSRVANPEKWKNLKKMFQVGDKIFPAEHAAEAMKIKRALEAAGQIDTNKAIRDLGRPQSFGTVKVKE